MRLPPTQYWRLRDNDCKKRLSWRRNNQQSIVVFTQHEAPFFVLFYRKRAYSDLWLFWLLQSSCCAERYHQERLLDSTGYVTLLAFIIRNKRKIIWQISWRSCASFYPAVVLARTVSFCTKIGRTEILKKN